jgi:hypothetical protein
MRSERGLWAGWRWPGLMVDKAVLVEQYGVSEKWWVDVAVIGLGLRRDGWTRCRISGLIGKQVDMA